MPTYSGNFKGIALEVTTNDIEEAFQKTEEEYDEFDSKTKYVEIDGEKKPQKEVFLNLEQIENAGFENKDFATNNTDRIFRNAEIPIVNEYSDSGRYLKETLKEFCGLVDEERINKGHDSNSRAAKLVEKRAKKLFGYFVLKNTEYSKEDFKINSSTGSGTWAEFSWLGIKSVEGETLEGKANPVLLIDPIKEKLYLSLDQKVERDNDQGGFRTHNNLKEENKVLQEGYSLERFSKGPLEISKDRSTRPIKYGIGSAFYKEYEISNLDLEEFENDVEEITRVFLENVGENVEDIKSIEMQQDERHPELKRLLEEKKQVILYGPPGTGKTYAATQFAQKNYADEDGNSERYQVVAFHPSYSYEEFVEGIKADTTEDGDVFYDEEGGIFLEICEDARKDPENDYLLIIDEINRGNISSIFGELITLLEKDKRGDLETRLPYSGSEFTIPENLHIVGTMNTADRSIALMDVALRRRFAHLEFDPKIDVYWKDLENGYSSKKNLKEEARDGDLRALSVLGIESINKSLMNQGLDSGKKIGHTYFIDTQSSEDVLRAWKYEIIPLLQEYFHQDYSKISDLFDTGEEEKEIINAKMKTINDFEEELLVQALRNLVQL